MKHWCGSGWLLLCSLAFAASGYAQVQLGAPVTDEGTLGEPAYQPSQVQLGAPVTDEGSLGEPGYQSDQVQLGTPVTDHGGLAGLDYQAARSPAPMPDQIAEQTPEQLQQLVAPIALYSDALVAQVLAGSTYPTEVVEAQRWMQQHSDLKGSALAQAVDQQPWDPSVRALTQFPSVLANLDKNLSWTSALGDAYVSQPQAVLDAVQTMRRRAQQAGNLQSTAQQTVTTQGQTVIIQPASPQIVYVPAYNPWLVYGPPIVAYPGWVAVPGLFVATPGIYYGAGFGIGFFAGFGWGWPAWACDWSGRRVIYQHNIYVSHSITFNHHRFEHGGFGHAGFDHDGRGHGGFDGRGPRQGGFDHGGFGRGGVDQGGFGHGSGDHGGGDSGGFGHGSGDHGGGDQSGFGHGGAGDDGFGQDAHGGFDRDGGMRGDGGHAGAFSGFDHGGRTQGYSARGHASFGGGFHDGGGGHR